MIVKAPGVIKLTGEHAVVYGKLSLAAAIRLYASVEVKPGKLGELSISLPQFNVSAQLGEEKLSDIRAKYAAKKDWASFISEIENLDIDAHALPYAAIAARLSAEFGIAVLGLDVQITSEIPPQSGCASSAACSTAFTVALASNSKAHLPDETLIDVARDGERVVHKSPGAGKIDVSTSYYGGYVSYSQQTGARHESITSSPRLVLVNTGPKKSTAETVGHVAEMYKKQKEHVESILEKINMCSSSALSALRSGDMPALGKCMFEDQALLKDLGVSSDGLDRAVEIAKSNGAYGAKLSGGGGGGIAIVLPGEPDTATTALKDAGFDLFDAKVALDGAASYATR